MGIPVRTVGITSSIFYAALEWQNFKAKAYALMLQAEKLAKDKILTSEAAQEEWVVDGLYIIFKRLKILNISKERLKPIIHYLYVKAMDFLDDGEFNNSVK